jgi:glutamine amidotransferase
VPEAVTPCLGILGGRVVRFRPTDPAFKVPHMGWNAVEFKREHPVLAGIPSGVEFYFVHSFHPDGLAPGDVVGTTEYAVRFCSILGRGNLIATQFHAEKSGRFGLQLIENFTRWKP